jgi:hypothetical protein
MHNKLSIKNKIKKWNQVELTKGQVEDGETIVLMLD